MRKLVLLSTVLFATPFTMNMSYGQCVNTLDCQALGYNKPSCINGGVKCPTGNYWYCPKDCEEGYVFINGKCIQDEVSCTYGDIYYSDKTCKKEYDSSKSPIGVVAYDENGEKWIMALRYADTGWNNGSYWSLEFIDVPNIPNDYSSLAPSYSDSCNNTQAMLARDSNKYPAAKYAKEFAPLAAPQTQGQWCLPSAGLWKKVKDHLQEVETGIQKARGIKLGYNIYWSSSECNNSQAMAWYSGMLHCENKSPTSPDDNDITGNKYLNQIRPVMRIK